MQELTSKDQQLKMQMTMSLQDDDLKNTEKIWLKSGFFKDCQNDLAISKASFPELIFCYINQGQISPVKGGKQAIYLPYIVCGHIMPIANPDPSINLDTQKFKEDDVLIYMSVYNKSTGFSKEKSTVLYCTVKDPLPNISYCTSFKKHHGFLLDENQKKVPFSKLFLYLPATLERKEKFLQWKDHNINE